MEDNQILVLRDNVKYELLQIKTVEDGMTHLNKLKSIEVWVKAEKKDAELQNIVAEQKIRTQRILGELLSKEDLRGGDRKTENFKMTGGYLENIGVTPKQSSTFQQIASIPEDDFEEFIQEKKEAVNNAVAELTTTGAVRLAKTLQEKKDDLKVVQGLNKRLETEKELKQLAQHINVTYLKDERLFLIKQIKQ